MALRRYRFSEGTDEMTGDDGSSLVANVLTLPADVVWGQRGLNKWGRGGKGG